MKPRYLAAFAAAYSLSFAATAHAQAPRPPQIQSPVVHPDRKVTFNFRAPQAKKVELSAQFLKSNRLLTVDTNGVWSITVGPVEPNLYPYNFVVDGVGVADPNNQDLFPNERFKASLVDIPGDPPSLHAIQNVPHGELTYGYYDSKTLGRTDLSSSTRHRDTEPAPTVTRCCTWSVARRTPRRLGSRRVAPTSFSTTCSPNRRPGR